jgi:hypothetical protein
MSDLSADLSEDYSTDTNGRGPPSPRHDKTDDGHWPFQVINYCTGHIWMLVQETVSRSKAE